MRKQIGASTLHVTIAGSGPPILLVHGFPLDHTMWQAQIESLQVDHAVIAPDLAGFGQSDAGPGPFTMARYADELALLVDELTIDAPLVLCGLSMGGYIAWEFWNRHAGKLRAMILCDTRAAADSPEVARGREMMAQRVMLDGNDEVAATLIPKLVSPRTMQHDPSLVEQLNQMIRGTAPESIAAAQRAMAARQDFTDRLAEITLPCLCICGEDDAITPPSEMREMAAPRPAGEFVQIAGAGHMAPMEQPEATNEAIRRFCVV